MHEITPIQQKVLDFCRAYLSRNDAMPTTRVIQAEFKWASQSSAMHVIGALEAKAFLQRNEAGDIRFPRP